MMPERQPFATAADLYASAGWEGVLPLPARRKHPPPNGYTGRDGAYPSRAQIDDWAHEQGASNIGLRLPVDMVGIDVDDYNGKGGGDTWRALTARYGPLPDTWISTSRNDGISGIRIYRLPEPVALNDKPGPGVEIIQHHHRYIVCWPSIHPDTGDEYRWITGHGERSLTVPSRDNSPFLTADWIEGLRAPRERTIPNLGDTRSDSRWTRAVEAAYGRAMADLPGGRHDAALQGCAALVRLRDLGYPGAEQALERLETAFLNAVSDGTRSDREAALEWKRMLEGAVELVGKTASIVRPYADIVDEHRSDDFVDDITTPSAGAKGGVKDKLRPPPEPRIVWDQPVPLGSFGDKLPTFPTGVYAPWISDQVHGIADELQVPVDLPAMLALGALATIAAGRVKVVVAGTWHEPVNLYLVTAMPPGSGKSPASKAMLRPVQEYEAELIERARPLASRYEQEQRIREKAMRRAEDAGNVAEAAQLLLDMETAERVTIPQLTVDDSTPEALVGMLADNEGRAAILSTEGGLFDIMASSRYNDATAAGYQLYLKGWSGDWHKDLRVGRGRSNIEEVILTISLTVQPAVLAKLSAKPELAGVGLTARFMYAVPPNIVGRRDFLAAQPVDPGVADRYRQNVLTLARLLGQHHVPRLLRLTPQAANRFLRWHQDLEPRRRSKGDLKNVSEWSEKLRSCVVRVAGLLHLADGHDWDDIGVDTLERALTVGEYWLEHAKAVHDLWSGHPGGQLAQQIVDWIEEGQRAAFTARECYRELHLKAKQAEEALGLLGELGWIRQVSGEFGRGGKPTPAFRVNPAVTLSDTACHSPSEAPADPDPDLCHSSGTDTGPGFSETNEQAVPPDDTETDRSDLERHRVTSGHRDTSEDSLFVFGRARKGEPPATGDTGDTAHPDHPTPLDPEARPDVF